MMQNDEQQSKDMIKAVLQKIIDEMGSLESDRIMPEHRKPKVMAAKIDIATPKDHMDGEPDGDEGLDPSVLSELMDKAGEADESGELPEDRENDLPSEIKDAVSRKKQQGFYAGSSGVKNPNEDAGESIDEAEPENQRNQHTPFTPVEKSTTMENREGNDSASRSTSDVMGFPPDIMDAIRNKKRK